MAIVDKKGDYIVEVTKDDKRAAKFIARARKEVFRELSGVEAEIVADPGSKAFKKAKTMLGKALEALG